MANVNWRTINIDALDPDSPANFDLSTLTPAVQPVSTADVQSLAGQIRQLLRGGDSEGALQGALENPPYGADDKGKVRHGALLPHVHSIPNPPQTAFAGRCTPSISASGLFVTIVPVAAALGFRRPGRSAHALAQIHEGETRLTCVSSLYRTST
jgi:hypothetical protein